MSDQYPATLNVEIDRDRLRNYLQMKGLLVWAIPFSVLGGLFGFARLVRDLEHGLAAHANAGSILAGNIATGIGISLLIALFAYLVFSHRLASRFAASLKVTVEDAFLHVRYRTIVLCDRKLHFRSIVDYAVTQDFLMRYFGIFALQMATTAGGQNTNLVVPGVKDCFRMRDILADIDRLRENR